MFVVKSGAWLHAMANTIQLSESMFIFKFYNVIYFTDMI